MIDDVSKPEKESQESKPSKAFLERLSDMEGWTYTPPEIVNSPEYQEQERLRAENASKSLKASRAERKRRLAEETPLEQVKQLTPQEQQQLQEECDLETARWYEEHPEYREQEEDSKKPTDK